MTEESKLNEAISLLNFLQTHVDNYVRSSFLDLTFSLETLIKDLLNIFEEEKNHYINANEIKHNYPAIDLTSAGKNSAIQVTTNADAAKAKKTIKKYNEHNLKFSEIIIIGFCKTTSPTVTGAKVYGIQFLIDKIKHADYEKKILATDIIRRHIPINILHPLEDLHCFEVVFNVINRSAVRDMTAVEGNYENMVSGLKEVKEIITTGVIKGKSIRAKSLVEYTDNIQTDLSDIEFDISQIIQICNREKNKYNNDFICISFDDREQIDNLKMSIIEKTNTLSKKLGSKKQIK